MTSPVRVGVLHPGEMGSAVADLLQLPAGQAGLVKEVLVALGERSADTVQRAKAANLRDVHTLEALCKQADIILSILPPAFAASTAKQCAALGFKGLYCDANAISPQTSRQLGRILLEHGASYVDGAILGPPPRLPTAGDDSSQASPGKASPLLALAGKEAHRIAALFQHTDALRVEVLGDRIGQASAMKMCYSLYTKGVSALMLNIAALATAEDVGLALAEEFEISQPQAMPFLQQAVRSVPPKAWRFEGEMEEMASAFRYHDLAPGFAEGSGQVCHSLASFKGKAPGEVDVATIARKMLGWEDTIASVSTTDTTTARPSTAESSKPKILCLHGWRTSASIMEYQFRDFPSLAEYVFVDSCHPASGPPHGVIAAYFEPPFFEWWDKNEEHCTGLAQTLQYIKELNQTRGPFVGVAGFSQGAGLTALLATLAQNDPERAPLPNMKFAILTSPFIVSDPDYSRAFETPVRIPTFISFGETDYIRDRCEACKPYFPEAEVHIHTGGHEVPNKWNGKAVMEAVEKFLQKNIPQP
eukprot:m.104445 g.104445  ORF g.104445 m.104445 type:complete len:531 (+) comp15079_c0_seq1:325-1917(+)